jgi:hypothetical protein
MKVEILYHPGDANYTWKLWTGPDGINEYDGVAISLGEAFEEIIKHEIWNGMDYCGEKL